MVLQVALGDIPEQAFRYYLVSQPLKLLLKGVVPTIVYLSNLASMALEES